MKYSGIPVNIGTHSIDPKKYMNKIICETLYASAVFGLQKGYSTDLLTMEEFREAVVQAQVQLREETGILLSAKLTPCEIVFLGQQEPSVTLEFINYPKFPQEAEPWRKGILLLAERLMDLLHQNRVVIVFPDKSVMLERTGEFDPRIRV